MMQILTVNLNHKPLADRRRNSVWSYAKVNSYIRPLNVRQRQNITFDNSFNWKEKENKKIKEREREEEGGGSGRESTVNKQAVIRNRSQKTFRNFNPRVLVPPTSIHFPFLPLPISLLYWLKIDSLSTS